MTRLHQEGEVIDFLGSLRDSIRNNWQLIVIGGSCVGAVIAYRENNFVVHTELKELRFELDAFRAEYRTFHALGPDGFSNPQVTLALEKFIEGIIKANNIQLEAVRHHWRNELFDLNPQLKRPTE